MRFARILEEEPCGVPWEAEQKMDGTNDEGDMSDEDAILCLCVV